MGESGIWLAPHVDSKTRAVTLVKDVAAERKSTAGVILSGRWRRSGQTFSLYVKSRAGIR